MDKNRIDLIQKALQTHEIGGWLFYDIDQRCPVSYRVLGLSAEGHTSRRWFYLIPAVGEPIGLVHRVESTKLNSLPGKLCHYLSWRELEERLKEMLAGMETVAMQYSKMAAIPSVSFVDGGTVELIQSLGVEVVTSADLVQEFEATINDEGYESHLRAAAKIQQIKDEAFALVKKHIESGKEITEYELQQWIVAQFDEKGLDCMGHFPIVGVNDHPADPHFEPTKENALPINKGCSLLIDLWAKEKKAGSIFYDITWCAYVGPEVPKKYEEIFSIVVAARDAALKLIKERFAQSKALRGYEVDDACRAVVASAGYGQQFIHRTGHSIGETVHGCGANMDNLETKDERLLLPSTCFSIEPGIYLPGHMAVRSEINVFITKDKEIVVAGDMQRELVRIANQ